MADIVHLIFSDHTWLRRQFFLLDDARSADDLAAIWLELAVRLDIHADAEETVFYPALLKQGTAGDPEDETEDAIDDHNKIRRAVAESRRLAVGTTEWFEAVGRARTENGKHLDEEEREAMPDFVKSATLQQRHELGLAWLRFYRQHRGGRGVDTSDKVAEDYIQANQ